MALSRPPPLPPGRRGPPGHGGIRAAGRPYRCDKDIDGGSGGHGFILTGQARALRQSRAGTLQYNRGAMAASDEALPASSYAVVFTTVRSREDARRIADKLLSERLAACVQMLPIDSLYTWKGETVSDSEVLLLVKTRRELYAEIERTIVSLHNYVTPEILLLPVAEGLPAYLDWIDEVT